MKRGLLILIAGLIVGGLAFTGMYRAETANSCCRIDSNSPELAWLKQEYHLSDAEFTRVTELHEQYLAGCAERCHQIDLKNQELARLLAATTNVTPEIEKALADAAQLRAQCQSKMLAHFYQVSRTMPPEQGQRYLSWVQSQTLLTDTHSSMPGMRH
jgi:hypothetical protein